MEATVNNNVENLDAIEHQIFKAVEKVALEFENQPKEQRGNTWITSKIKQYIGKVGEENNWDICSTEHDGEWLYDLVWYRNDSNNCMEKVGLVLESELSDRKPQGLKYDFEKILAANSDFRAFICFVEPNFDYPNNVNRQLEMFEKSVAAYKNLPKGARILVLIWEDFTHGHIYPHLIIKE